MAKNWRAAVLLILFLGPILVYIGLGTLWLKERGWLMHGSLIWIGLGVLFGLLAERWTREKKPVLPPIDWELPSTFTPYDRAAWEIVEAEAALGDDLPLEALSTPEAYMETGKRLARALATHYRPDAQDPLEHVAIVDLLTALELAAEDLDHLCRQIPGGDLITPMHWKRAVQVSGYLQRANDIYSYVMPFVQPWTGLVRLGTQQLMVKPAWKNMQQNLLRWFWRAYVNRFGTHLIELYSGRLAIGADHYRRLTRRHGVTPAEAIPANDRPRIALVGSNQAVRDRVLAALDEARAMDLSHLRSKLLGMGMHGELVDRLKTIEWMILPEYPPTRPKESGRDRRSRAAIIEKAAQADLLFLVLDGTSEDHAGDAQFARDWAGWFSAHTAYEPAPTLVVMTGADTLDWGGPWSPPYDWRQPRRPREHAVQTRVESLRSQLPEIFSTPIAVGIEGTPPFGIVELVLPALATALQKAERPALIRRLNQAAGRSKATRLMEQVGEQGRRFWNGWGGAKGSTSASR